MEFLAGEKIASRIKEAFRKANAADLAVSYWGNGAIKRLGIRRLAGNTRIICDLRSGACNPSEIGRLRSLFNVKTQDGLHSKVYMTRSEVIVGSANASANGLGEENQEIIEDLEAATHTNDREVVKAASDWFEKRWSKAEEIDDTALEHAKLAWTERNKKQTLLSITGRTIGADIQVLVFTNENHSEYKAAWKYLQTERVYTREQEKKYADDYFPFYLKKGGLPSITVGNAILAFWYTKDCYQLECTGLWRIKHDGYKTPTNILLTADQIPQFRRVRVTSLEKKKLCNALLKQLGRTTKRKTGVLYHEPLHRCLEQLGL